MNQLFDFFFFFVHLPFSQGVPPENPRWTEVKCCPLPPHSILYPRWQDAINGQTFPKGWFLERYQPTKEISTFQNPIEVRFYRLHILFTGLFDRFPELFLCSRYHPRLEGKCGTHQAQVPAPGPSFWLAARARMQQTKYTEYPAGAGRGESQVGT